MDSSFFNLFTHQTSLQDLMKEIGEALRLDDESHDKDAYIKYASCIYKIASNLLHNARVSYCSFAVTPTVSRQVKLLQQCVDRVASLVEKMEQGQAQKPSESLIPTNPGVQQMDMRGFPGPPKNSNSLNDETIAPAEDEHFAHTMSDVSQGVDPGGHQSLPIHVDVPALAPENNPHIYNKVRTMSPLERAHAQNKSLIIAYKARMKRLNKSNFSAYNYSLTLQRKMAENLAIAKAQEEELAKKMKARQERLEEEAARRFAYPNAMSSEEKEHQQMYKNILDYENDVERLAQWRQKLSKGREDPVLICQILQEILRCSDHPFTQMLRKLQFKVHEQLYPLVANKHPSLDMIKVDLPHHLWPTLDDVSDILPTVIVRSSSVHPAPEVRRKKRIRSRGKSTSEDLENSNVNISEISKSPPTSSGDDDEEKNNSDTKHPNHSTTKYGTEISSVDVEADKNEGVVVAASQTTTRRRADDAEDIGCRHADEEKNDREDVGNNKAVLRGNEMGGESCGDVHVAGNEELAGKMAVRISDINGDAPPRDCGADVKDTKDDDLCSNASIDGVTTGNLDKDGGKAEIIECSESGTGGGNGTRTSNDSNITPVPSSSFSSNSHCHDDGTVADRPDDDGSSSSSSNNSSGCEDGHDDLRPRFESVASTVSHTHIQLREAQDRGRQLEAELTLQRQQARLLMQQISRDYDSENFDDLFDDDDGDDNDENEDKDISRGVSGGSDDGLKSNDGGSVVTRSNSSSSSSRIRSEIESETKTLSIGGSEGQSDNDSGNANPIALQRSQSNQSRRWLSSCDQSSDEVVGYSSLPPTINQQPAPHTPAAKDKDSNNRPPAPSHNQVISRLTIEAYGRHLKSICNEVHLDLDKLLQVMIVAYEALDTPVGKDQCAVALEEPFFKPIWKTLLRLYRVVHHRKETVMACVMTSYKGARPETLNVRDKFCCAAAGGQGKAYQEAIDELLKLPQYYTIVCKLDCVVNVCRLICECVDKFYSSQESENPQGKGKAPPVLGADDLVPVLTYVIVSTECPQLVSECLAMTEFIAEGYMMGEEGYCLTTFRTALEYLISLFVPLKEE